jgi:hypothetical protein
MNRAAKVNNALGSIGIVLCAGASYHRRFTIFVVLVVPSSRRNLKFLRAKRKAQEAFVDGIKYRYSSFCGLRYDV